VLVERFILFGLIGFFSTVRCDEVKSVSYRCLLPPCYLLWILFCWESNPILILIGNRLRGSSHVKVVEEEILLVKE